MYRTTSVMALGLFIGLAPIGALAQTQTDNGDTQLQTTTQSSDTQQSNDSTMQSDEQNVEVDLEGDESETATDTQTDTSTGDDAEMTTQTETETTTGDDAQMTTDTQTETSTGGDTEMTTDTQTTTGDDAEVVTETEVETTTGDDAEMATDSDTATDEAEVQTTEAEDVPDVIPEQDTSEMLGSSLMGASVNLADEEIGNVSDIIIADDNSIRGVVVGVGGFLGIGEKRVALPIERLTIQSTEPGEVEISTDMTREELEQKEAFKTAAQVQSEEEAAQAQQDAGAQQPMAPTVPAE